MGLITKGMGAILKKAKPKSKWIKDKAGTITGVKPGSGNIPWHVGAGKTLKKRGEIVKINKRVETIDAIKDAQDKIKQGTATLKKLRTTGWTRKIGAGKTKSYHPKEEGKMAHTVKKKK